MRKRSYRWYRHPKTTAERRANQDGWSRARRNQKNLVDYYDDIPISTSKSWKDKRKTQYRPEGRGKRHEIYVDSCYYEWEIAEYLRNHDIPHHIETICKRHVRYRWQYTKSVFVGYKEIILRDKTYWWPKWETVDLEKPICRKAYWSETLGYKITWWSNKDIGIDYILKATRVSKYYG